MEWITRPLGEITSYMAKGIPPKYTEEETENTVRVLNQKCNRNFTISYADSRIHDCTQKKVPSDKLLKKGDVLINSTGTGTAGRVAQMMEIPIPTTIDGHMILLRPSKEMDAFYYGYAVKAHQAQIETLAEGSTGQTEINRNRLQTEVMITYPENKKVQAGIASFLWDIDRKIEANNKINENLQQQALALFANYYEQSNTEVAFTDLIQILGGGTPKTGESKYWNGNIPFFTPKDVGSPYTLATEKTITEDGLSHCNSRLYPANTVFVTARGTVGKIGLAGVPMAMNQSCYALAGKNLHQLLVYFYTLKAVDRLKHKASGAVFDAIITRDFETEQVFKLSEDDTNTFIKIAEPMYQSILNNSVENQRLVALRDSLLPKLMSGEIDVSGISI